MVSFVLAAWIVQAAVGLTLLVSAARQGRARAPAVVVHVALVVVFLALWIAFDVTGHLLVAWAGFALLTVGLAAGDTMLARRAARGASISWGSYGAAIAGVFRGRMPVRVAFHALFSAVVYFSSLGVCIGATVAAAQ